MNTRICRECDTPQEENQFYTTETKSGWTAVCKTCRRRKHWAVKKKEERKVKKQLARVTRKQSAVYLRDIKSNIFRLTTLFNQFTFQNRSSLYRLRKNLAEQGDTPSKKTLKAIARREAIQKQAEAILKYQIEMTKLDVTPPSINDLWRYEYGDDTGKESQNEDNQNP